MKMKIFGCIALAALLGACATPQTRKAHADWVARVHAAAGAPVNSIHLQNRGFYSWRSLNDHQVLAYDTPFRAYLIDLPSCPGLTTSNGIGISSNMSQVNINFDHVTPFQTGIPCSIRQIRPVDVKMLKAKPGDMHKDVKVEQRSKSTGSGS
jgi:hypothetical protein